MNQLRAELERRKQEAEEQARRTREEKRRKLAEARAAREAAKAGGSAQPVAPAAAPASAPATAPSAQQLTVSSKYGEHHMENAAEHLRLNLLLQGMSTESEGRAERLRRLKEERCVLQYLLKQDCSHLSHPRSSQICRRHQSAQGGGRPWPSAGAGSRKGARGLDWRRGAEPR